MADAPLTPPATPALSDEQIGAICDQFKTLIRQKRQVHLRRGLDAGADYYIGDAANYVGHAVKEAANARIAELIAENKMLSRSLDESLFVDLQCVAERAAAQPQPQPAQPLTGAVGQGVPIGPAGLELLIAEINKLPAVRAAEIDGEESDGTPRHWRDRPHVSLRKLERLLREFFTPPPVDTPTPPEVAP